MIFYKEKLIDMRFIKAAIKIGMLVYMPYMLASESQVEGHDTVRISSANTNLTLDAEIGFSYVDAVNFPWTESNALAPDKTLQSATAKTTRTLGLSQAKLKLSFEQSNKYFLNFVLRPDYGNYSSDEDELEDEGANSVKRDIDRRAGSVYRLKPEIKLLDSYDLTIEFLSQFSFQLGVFNERLDGLTSYVTPLEFGLEVYLPKKFFGAGFTYNSYDKRLSSEASYPSYNFDVVVFEGRDDRAENWMAKDETNDTTPSAKDPYKGGALSGYYNFMRNFNLYLLLGYLDNELSDYLSREQFGGFAIQYGLLEVDIPIKLSADMYFAKENFRSTSANYSNLIQQSSKVTVSANYNPKSWLLLGFYFGKSERFDEANSADKMEVSGLQFEVGLMRRIARGFDVTLMLANENREKKTSGDGSDGAFVIKGKNEKTLQRVGFEVKYVTN